MTGFSFSRPVSSNRTPMPSTRVSIHHKKGVLGVFTLLSLSLAKRARACSSTVNFKRSYSTARSRLLEGFADSWLAYSDGLLRLGGLWNGWLACQFFFDCLH